VSSRNAIHSIFREPVTGGLVASEAVRTPSQSVDLESHNKNQRG
jgi:hypothetical protein